MYLAERTHKRKYAQTAYNILKESVRKLAIRGMLGQAYIRKADAARVLGNMDGCVEDLAEGLRIAIRVWLSG